MVSFVCYYCNLTLKKKQLQTHQYACRQPSKFTCIDCRKTFEGDEHVGHITCMTEQEKYWGQYGKKKGAQAGQKQNENGEAAKTTSNNNANKLQNKVAPIFGKWNGKTYIDSDSDGYVEQQKSPEEKQTKKQTPKPVLEKKEETQETPETPETTWKGWKSEIKSILEEVKSQKKKLKFKTLQKLVLQRYNECFAESEDNQEQLLEAIDSKLRKLKGISIVTQEYIVLEQ